MKRNTRGIEARLCQGVVETVEVESHSIPYICIESVGFERKGIFITHGDMVSLGIAIEVYGYGFIDSESISRLESLLMCIAYSTVAIATWLSRNMRLMGPIIIFALV